MDASMFPFTSIAIPEPSASTPPLFNVIKLSQMSKLMTFKDVIELVTENVFACMSSTNRRVPIRTFPKISMSALKNASFLTLRPLFNETSLSTIIVPRKMVSSPIAKLPLNDASPDTFKFWLRETSPRTARVESSEVFPTVCNEPCNNVSSDTVNLWLRDALPRTDKMPFRDISL